MALDLWVMLPPDGPAPEGPNSASGAASCRFCSCLRRQRKRNKASTSNTANPARPPTTLPTTVGVDGALLLLEPLPLPAVEEGDALDAPVAVGLPKPPPPKAPDEVPLAKENEADVVVSGDDDVICEFCEVLDGLFSVDVEKELIL